MKHVPDTPREAALYYARNGLSVIPCGQDKRPLIPWKQFHERIATPEEINEWYEKYPNANVGIVTGPVSNIAVVDIELNGDISYLPETARAKTGGGGYHYFYRYPKAGIKNSTRLKPLTDIRGQGGYVVAAPSMHASGKRYEWLEFDNIVPFPSHLFADSQSPFSSGPTPIKKAADWSILSTGAKEGSRNDTAAKVAGKIFRSLHPRDWEHLGWTMMDSWNKKNTPPLPVPELQMVFDSIRKMAEKDDRRGEVEEDPEEKAERVADALSKVEKVTWTEALEMGERELLATKPGDCISFGYNFLDDALTGIFPGELILVGGVTGSGKSTYAMNVMFKAATKGHKCFVFALEDRLEDYAMKAIFYQMNLIAKELDGEKAGYSWNLFRRNMYVDDRYKELRGMAKKKLANGNITFIKIDGRLNFEIIEGVINEEVKNGTELFLIDHLHHLDLDSSGMTRASYIENVLVDIKNMQRRNGARIMLVAHYKKIDGQLPTLDSFKDSASLAQNASYVINIFRERGESHKEKKKGKTLTASLSAFSNTQDPRYCPTYFLIPKSRNPNGEHMVVVNFDKLKGDYVDTQAKEMRPMSDMVKKKP